MSRDLAQALAGYAFPLLEAARSREALETLLAELGWRLELTEAQAEALQAVLPAVEELRELIELAQRDEAAEGGEWVAQALDLGAAVMTGVRELQTLDPATLATLPAPLNDSANWAELALELPEYLLLRWLGVSFSPVYAALYFVGAIEETPRPDDLPPRRRLVWSAVERLLSDPARQTAETYDWGGELDHRRLLKAISLLAQSIGFPVTREALAEYLAEGLEGDEGFEQLRAPLLRGRGPAGLYRVDLLAAPTAPGGAGAVRGALLAAEVQGPAPKAADLGDGWTLGLTADGDTAVAFGLRLLPTGVEPLLDSPATPEIVLQSTPEEPWTILGSAEGARLELDSFRAALTAAGPLSDLELIVDVETGEGLRLVIDPGEGDSFLADVLGDEELAIAAPVGLRWSSRDGFSFAGGVGLEAVIPIGKTIGPLHVFTLRIAVAGGSDGVRFEVALSGTLQIGPFVATAEGVGFRASAGPPSDDENGDIGPLKAATGMLPPTRFGFAIDAGIVSGGGFLGRDPEKGEYAGALDLQFASFGLTAIGLISTQLPDGRPGWSMFLSLTARLTGVQLGFGFTLNGVGGLAGVHRRMDLEALRQGLAGGALDSVLFPENPIANAPVILANLDAIFPPERGQYVFGPVLAIGWGAPQLLEIQLGVIVQFPDPITIALIGSLDVAIPPPKKDLPDAGDGESAAQVAVIDLHFALLGVADLSAGTLAIDASLYDSTIIGFRVSGDMAFRASFLENPTWLIAVGGFHPDFTPPEGFPALERMQLGLGGDESSLLRLQFESYQAVAAGTVQFGAAFEIWAQALGFVAEGGAEFDALIGINPLRMTAAIGLHVSMRAGSWELLTVALRLELTGPNPWRGVGAAVFEVLKVKKEFEVEGVFGIRRGDPPAPAVNVLDRVLEALAAPDAWKVEAGDAGAESVLASSQASAEAAWPSGSLAVGQTVAPLGITLDKFGDSPIEGPTRLELSEVRAGGLEIDVDAVTDWFAAAQFLRLGPRERLAAPSFERLDAGLRLSDDAVGGGDPKEYELGYETILVDPELPLPTPLDSQTPMFSRVEDWAPSATLRSPFALDEPGWATADAASGEPIAKVRTYAQARELAAQAADSRTPLTILPSYEAKP